MRISVSGERYDLYGGILTALDCLGAKGLILEQRDGG